METLYNFDLKWFFSINQGWHCNFLNPIFIFLTDRNSGLLILLAYLGYLIYQRDKQEWFYLVLAGVAVGLSDLFSSSVLKQLFERTRPCQIFSGINFWNQGKYPEWLITDGITDYKSSKSFPSSHAANSMAFAVFVGWRYKKIMSLLVVIAVLIGISRVYVGVHYPSDVLGGMSVGVFMAFLVKYSSEMIKEKFFH